jgi:hypothetical protein
MPEFEGVSETLSVQEALEAAVRKAYTAHQRRTHTEPLFSYVVKRIGGHLRTVTVVIETVLEETSSVPAPAAVERSGVTPPAADPIREPAAADPIRELLDRQRRGEPLSANEQALIDLLRQDPKGDR